MADLARRIAVARGAEPADLGLTGGRVLSVFTREWLEVDVAIVDVRMPGGGGVTATIGIKQSSPKTRVIAFSAENDDTIKAAMVAAGASGYLVKGTAIDMILETLRDAAH